MHVVNTVSSVNSVRHKSGTGTITPTSQNVASPGASAAAAGAVGNVAQPVGGQNQFQRLKVEDALSYLDQVGNPSLYPLSPSQYLSQVSDPCPVLTVINPLTNITNQIMIENINPIINLFFLYFYLLLAILIYDVCR